MSRIEIDLAALHKAQSEGESKGRPGLVKRKVKVHRGGKVFEQYRWVKSGAEEPAEEKPSAEEPTVDPTKKPPAIMGLNKPSPEPEKPEVGKKPKVEKKPEKSEKLPTNAKKSMVSHIDDLNKTPEGEDSLFSIEKYTGGDYKSFNGYLRSGKMPLRDMKGKAKLTKPSKKQKEKIDTEMGKVSDFLKNAPKMEGKVYRGMMWKQDKKSTKEFSAFIDKVNVGSEIIFPTFSSTSTDESTATEFATLASKKEPVHSVVIEMQSKSGVYLNGASAFEVEDEVLFDRDSKFKVLKVDRNVDPIRMILAEV